MGFNLNEDIELVKALATLSIGFRISHNPNFCISITRDPKIPNCTLITRQSPF